MLPNYIISRYIILLLEAFFFTSASSALHTLKSFSDVIYPEQFQMERSTGANSKASGDLHQPTVHWRYCVNTWKHLRLNIWPWRIPFATLSTSGGINSTSLVLYRTQHLLEYVGKTPNTFTKKKFRRCAPRRGCVYSSGPYYRLSGKIPGQFVVSSALCFYEMSVVVIVQNREVGKPVWKVISRNSGKDNYFVANSTWNYFLSTTAPSRLWPPHYRGFTITLIWTHRTR